MTSSFLFGDKNSGLQVGDNHGKIDAQFHLSTGRSTGTLGCTNPGRQRLANGGLRSIERSEIYNTQGGAIFTGNLSAYRDINIRMSLSATSGYGLAMAVKALPILTASNCQITFLQSVHWLIPSISPSLPHLTFLAKSETSWAFSYLSLMQLKNTPKRFIQTIHSSPN